MRIDAGVGPEQQLDPRLYGAPKGLALREADRLFLVEAFLLGAVRGARREDIIVIVDIHVEPGPVFDRKLDRRIAREAAMLDRVDPGEDRGPDAVVAMRVRRHLQPQHMRLVRDRLHLLERQLLGTDAVAE